jgi:anti-sigma factor RsiW
MDCAQTRRTLEQYHDGELDGTHAGEIQEHLRDCPACSMIEDRLEGLRAAVRVGASHFAAPESLRRRVAALQPKRRRLALLERTLRLPGWVAAGSLAAAAALSAALTLTIVARGPSEDLTREVVADHVRSLMADHLADVASSDQHTVKPWFSGKLDFAPPVRDLAASGFPLIGGRLDYLDGRTAAALVYQRRQHRINVFVTTCPGGCTDAERRSAVNGYNVIGWSAGGLRLWAVSDLNAAELSQLVDLLRDKG